MNPVHYIVDMTRVFAKECLLVGTQEASLANLLPAFDKTKVDRLKCQVAEASEHELVRVKCEDCKCRGKYLETAKSAATLQRFVGGDRPGKKGLGQS